MVSSPKEPPKNTGECELLGKFAILVQGALGVLALLALVYKRWRERPQRPVKVWFFDASKQVVGSVLVHIANLLMSMLSSGQFSISLDASTVAQRGLNSLIRRVVDGEGGYSPNPCSFYLLNLAIDVSRYIIMSRNLLTETLDNSWYSNSDCAPPSLDGTLSLHSRWLTT